MEIDKSLLEIRAKGSKIFMKSVVNSIKLPPTEDIVPYIARKIGKIYATAGIWIDGKNIYEYRNNMWVPKSSLISELRCLGIIFSCCTGEKEFMKSTVTRMIKDYIILEQTRTEEKLLGNSIWCYPNGYLVNDEFFPWSENVIPPFDPDNSRMGVEYTETVTIPEMTKLLAYTLWQMHTVCIKRDTNIVYAIGEYATSFLEKMKAIYGTYVSHRVQIVKELPKKQLPDVIYMVDCSVAMPSVDHTCVVVNCKSEIDLTPTDLWNYIRAANEVVEQPISMQSIYETIRFDTNSVERYVATCMHRVPEDQRSDDISVDKSNTCILYKEKDIIMYYNAFCRKYGLKKLQSVYLLNHIAACGFPISGPIGNREIETYIV